MLNSRFKPTLAGTALAILCLALFSGLGFWQLDRAAQKRRLQAEYEQRTQEPAVVLEGREVLDELRFRQGRASGYYDAAHEILLDNRVHQGQAGYHVLTPLRLENSDRAILVDRGWVPMGQSRQDLPVIDTPATRLEVQGTLERPPGRPLALGADTPATVDGGKVWLFLDLDYFAREAGYKPAAYVLALAPAQPHGFVRERTRFDARVGMHIGYAIHWFAFAVATLVLYVYLGWRRTVSKSKQEST